MCSALKHMVLGRGGAGKTPASDPDPPNDDEEYNIQQTSDEHMKIYVKVCMDREIVLEVSPTDTIQLVKAQIQGREGIRWRDQRLHFGHYYRDLQDGAPLHHYNIQDGDLLTLGVRGFGGANKRGADDVFRARDREMARIHADIELLLGPQNTTEDNKTKKVREEINRIDSTYRTWDFLDEETAEKLTALHQTVKDMKPKHEKKIGELFKPYWTTMHQRLQNLIERVKTLQTILGLQCQLNVVRMLMTNDGYNDYKSFEELLREKAIFRRGREFGRMDASGGGGRLMAEWVAGRAGGGEAAAGG
jgi:large subunit ribosomal protein L40e